jgi:hypothetical protein
MGSTSSPPGSAQQGRPEGNDDLVYDVDLLDRAAVVGAFVVAEDAMAAQDGMVGYKDRQQPEQKAVGNSSWRPTSFPFLCLTEPYRVGSEGNNRGHDGGDTAGGPEREPDDLEPDSEPEELNAAGASNRVPLAAIGTEARNTGIRMRRPGGMV